MATTIKTETENIENLKILNILKKLRFDKYKTINSYALKINCLIYLSEQETLYETTEGFKNALIAKLHEAKSELNNFVDSLKKQIEEE